MKSQDVESFSQWFSESAASAKTLLNMTFTQSHGGRFLTYTFEVFSFPTLLSFRT